MPIPLYILVVLKIQSTPHNRSTDQLIIMKDRMHVAPVVLNGMLDCTHAYEPGAMQAGTCSMQHPLASRKDAIT